MGKILKVSAIQIFDGRGFPTIECEIKTNKGYFMGAVPSGASTGKHEALELRDGAKEFGGKGVRKAIENINKIIAPKLEGMDPCDQKAVDRAMIELDGTPNKSKLGANAIIAVSLTVAKAGAGDKNVHIFQHLADLSGNNKFALPVPQLNVINGGAHAGLENDIQEHLIMPIGAKTFSGAMRMGVEVYQELKKSLRENFGPRSVLLGDEGGFVPPFESAEERLEVIIRAIENCGYSKEMALALDSASSEFFDGENYTLAGKKYSSGELIDYYSGLAETYNIYSFEDPMAEDDWQGWQEIMKKLGGKRQIIGDDLLVTNPERITKAAQLRACNALLLKINQIGSISEALGAAHIAFDKLWEVVVSHRSGETGDPFIADLAVGLGASQCKFGAPARTERTAKYNQLLIIEDYLNHERKSEYAGKSLK